ncbi:MAG TPA: DMT family transporter [Pseudomonadota bacterium]|nr:DMT family transporter [Pseudomonadota bacterium]
MLSDFISGAALAGVVPLLAEAGTGAEKGWLGPACALASSLTWAYGSAIYAREASRVGPAEVNLARSLLVLPLFALAMLVTVGPQALGQLRWANLGWLSLSMLCSYGLGDLVFYMTALRLGTPTALAISSAYPVWSALLGALTLGERIGGGRALGIACCIGGVAWLVMLQVPPGERAPARGRTLAGGVALAIVTSILWAGNAYCIRRGAALLPMFLVNTFRYFMAVLLLSGMWLVQRRRRRASGSAERLLLSRPHLRRFLPTVLIEALVGSSIFVYGLSHSDLSVAAPLSSLAPLFAVPIGLYLGTERLHLRRLLAIVITVAGVILLVS